MPRLALLAQLATTLPLVGLIWMVQVVVYPQLGRVGEHEFVAYHAAHARLITPVVGPLMLGELLAAIAFVSASSASESGTYRSVAVVGLLLVGVAWLTTMFLSVPQHEVLARGFDEHAWQRLVTTNWLRTIAWTARAGLLLWATSQALRPSSPALP
jgi:hypothetical protein